MSDDRLDAFKIVVGGGFGRRQYVFVIENVETLILHCTHVEIGDRDDHENVEIVFAAERGFIPAHSALERIHGIEATPLFAWLDIDAQHHLPTRHGDEAILDISQLPADEGEEI